MEPAVVLPSVCEKSPGEDRDPKERCRHMIHEGADQWIDQLMFVFEEDRRPTLTELSELFTETRGPLLGACLQHLIEHKYEDLLKQEHCTCPSCGKLQKKRREVPKKTDTMQGQGRLTRTWFYGTDCGLGFSPADAALEISRRVKQFDIQKKCVKLAAQVTLACAG